MAANGVYYSLNQGLLLSTGETNRVNISTGGTVTFNSAYSFPTSDGTNTHVLQTNGNGALSFGLVQNSALQNSSSTITAGDGLTSGGTLTLGGSVTLAVDYSGADNVILAATNQTSTQVTTGSKIMVSDASNNVNYHNVSDLPFTNNVGTVTSVGITAGALIDVSNSPITTSGNITVAVDLSELVTTSDDANLDFLPIINSSNQQFKIAPSNVALSLFNNDAGWTSNVGTVTSVAITGTDGIDVDSGSPITSSGTITLGLSNVPNSSLANSSITFAGDSGSNQIMSLGETFTIEGGGGIETSAGTDKIVVSHYNAGAAPSNLNSNNSNGTVIQDLTMSFDTYGHVTGATVGTANLDTRYLSFRTINVPTGTDPVADAYNDTLNFISSDGSVVISGNSTTDTIDITVGSGVDTFVTGGTFTSGTLSLGLNDGSSASDITGFGTVTSVGITAGNLVDVTGGPVTGSGSITVNVDLSELSTTTDDDNLDFLPAINSSNQQFKIAPSNVALSLFNNDQGWTSNAGTVTSVTVGTGLDVTNGTTTPNITLDLSELATSTSDADGDFFVVVDSSNVQRKLTKGNINLSGFNNDAGFTTNTGTVTSVAITGTDGIDVDSGSPITTSGTITLGLSNVPNSSLQNSSITVTAGDGLTGGGTPSLGGSVTVSHADTSSDSGFDSNNSNGVVIQDVTVALDTYGHVTGTTVGTVNLDSRYYTETEADARFLSFRTINVPTGTDPVADAYNDTLNFVSSDSSVVISGNSTTDTIDIKVGSGVNTNIYNANGTLSGSRTLSQGGNALIFDSSSTEQFRVVKDSSAVPGNNPRMFIEADNAYGTVLELESPEEATYFIRARNTAGDVLFDVDGEGNLRAQSKSFDIAHPTKEGKRLRYGSLEGPEHGVYVRGRLNGTDTIELPDYWLALVDESSITVQLTPVGSSQPLYVKDIRDNKVIVGNGSVLTNTPINCFYFVQAERKDVNKITVEY